MSFLRVALLAGAVFACAVSPAQATHWPGLGGDAGRSGAQPVDAGVAPLEPVWKMAGTVKTAVVTSGGTAATQRVMYGTTDGVVHFRRLDNGATAGSADVGDDPDVFGTVSVTPGANRADVAFADTSTGTALGQLFVAHNEGAGIEIAHLDETDGSLVEQFPVPGTIGMTIESSLLATPTALFFVAGGELFKVPVSNAQQHAAAFGTVTHTADVNASPVASPTLLSLDVLGRPTAHVAIGTADGWLRTYRASDLTPGAAMDLSIDFGGPKIDAGDVMTPSVPVQPDGEIAGEAPFVYVAASGDFPFFATDDDTVKDTIAYKLRVADGAFDFQFEFLPIPDTDPAPALAVSQLATPEAEDAEVLIGTSTNLFLATTRDMDLTGEIDFESDLQPGVDGFRQTTAATSGPLYYVTNDRGEQLVGRLSDGKTVPDGEFPRDAGNAGAANGGVGQPSISRGYVAFGGPDGVFVYRNADATDPEVALTAPADEATVSGDVTVSATASDERGIDRVEFLANGRSIGIDHAAGSGDAFSVTLDTDALPAGEYVLEAVATDGGGRSALSESRRIVVPPRGGGPAPAEDLPPTVSFTRPAAGAHLSGTPTLAADAADDRGVASVRFLAGERTVCTDTTAPYECASTLTADDVGRTTLIAVATDTAGQTAAAVRGVRVSRFTPPAVKARTTRRGLRFTTSGIVRRPKGVTAKQACGSGFVSVQVKAVHKTISTRRVQLTRSCTYRSRVSCRSRKRFPRSGKLTVRVRFLGNAVLGSRRAKSAAIRTR